MAQWLGALEFRPQQLLVTPGSWDPRTSSDLTRILKNKKQMKESFKKPKLYLFVSLLLNYIVTMELTLMNKYLH